MKKPQPIRMCVSCRQRQEQGSLIRLKLTDKEIFTYNGQGRSMYLCHECSQNEKKIRGMIKRFKVDEERFTKLLQELTKHG